MPTELGDLVVDPSAGLNTTGAVCEVLVRKWLALDLSTEYLEASRCRSESPALGSLSGRTALPGDKPYRPEEDKTVLPLFKVSSDD